MIELVNLGAEHMPAASEYLNLCREKLFYHNRPIMDWEIGGILGDAKPGTRTYSFGILEGEKITGIISLQDVDPIHRSGTIGNLAVRGIRTGIEAGGVLLKYAFDTLGLNRVDCRVWEDNRFTPILCKKWGATYEGRIRQAIYREGRFYDVLIYSMLKKEWNDGTAKT